MAWLDLLNSALPRAGWATPTCGGLEATGSAPGPAKVPRPQRFPSISLGPVSAELSTDVDGGSCGCRPMWMVVVVSISEMWTKCDHRATNPS